MNDRSACPGCGAPTSADDHECDAVRCWDCGQPSPGRVFCRSCGAWLGASASGPATPEERRAVHRPAPPAMSAPLGVVGRARARRRGRRIAVTATVLLLAGVVSLVAVTSWAGRPATPGAGGVAAAARPGAGGVAAATRTSSSADTRPWSSAAPSAGDGFRSPRPQAPSDARAAVAEPEATAAPGVLGGTPRPGPALPAAPQAAAAGRSTGWTCDGTLRLADPGTRWRIERVSFRVLGGYERVIVHLRRGSSARGGATAIARVAGPAGVSVDLTGVSSGLDLRGFRPSGMRFVRGLWVSGAAGGARVRVAAAPATCARIRVPAWGAAGRATSGELVIDLRR